MSLQKGKNMFKYGNEVFGYDELVINEREARAGAGILLTLGLITVMNSVMIGNGILSRVYLAFFMFKNRLLVFVNN